jgi:hypothetical protein
MNLFGILDVVFLNILNQTLHCLTFEKSYMLYNLARRSTEDLLENILMGFNHKTQTTSIGIR